jgi:hypothetical protein
MASNTSYADLIADAPGSLHCIKHNRLTIYFVKVNQMNEGYIQNSGYAAFCANDSTKQSSLALTLLNEETIELADSTWDPSVRLMTGARFSFSDLDKDGVSELLIKERVHNGTVYHAVVDRVYEINPVTLNLELKFLVEEVSYVPLDSAYVKREIDGNNVNVYYGRKIGERGKLIGNYTIDRSGAAADFVSFDERYKDLLYTSSPTGSISDK